MSTDNLIHFSDAPITELLERQQDPDFFKPVGLWVSVEGNGDGWSDWCRNEDFRDCSKQLAYRITLRPKANVLRLTGDDLEDFTARYPAPRDVMRLPGYIDWPRVVADYDGIIIAPYSWKMRLSMATRWYSSWDCASGCIWNPRAVSELRLLERANAETQP